jgi:hypothetical protein
MTRTRSLAPAFALMLALGLGLGACGGGDDDTTEPTDQSGDTTSLDTSADTSSDTAADASDGNQGGVCGDLIEHFADIEGLSETDDPAAAVEGLGDAADQINEIVDAAPEEIRDDVEVVAERYADIKERLDDIDAASIDTSDPQEILAALDDLQPIFQSFGDDDFVQASIRIGRYCADAAVDEIDGIGSLDDDVVGESSESGMDAETSSCDDDASAEDPGDNDGCDALYDACDDGDMHACNDLYFAASIGTQYEEFGGTCGDRIQGGIAGSNGFCGTRDV